MPEWLPRQSRKPRYVGTLERLWMNLQACCDLEIEKTGWAQLEDIRRWCRCKLTRVAKRLSYRDRNGERCVQLPEGCQMRRWLALILALINGRDFEKGRGPY